MNLTLETATENQTPRNHPSYQSLLRAISVFLLIFIFAIYAHSIFNNQLFLGEGDRASRFMDAMGYGRNPVKALHLIQWLDVWPPVPMIIQGFILRLALFPGMTNIMPGIMAVELTSVFLTLLSFYFVSRAVALQTDELTGTLACFTCLCASTLLSLAHTPSSFVYGFFFISLAIWNLFRFTNHGKGFPWIILSFSLALFCRNESLIIAFIVGLFLMLHHRWKSGLALWLTMLTLIFSKVLLAFLLIDGPKFFQAGSLYTFGNTWENRLQHASAIVRQILSFNKEFISLAFVCLLPALLFSNKFRLNRHSSTKARNLLNAPFIPKDDLLSSSKNQKPKSFFLRIYSQANSWLVETPFSFWAILFAISIGILVAEALRGNIDSQWRYLSIANVFMTTAITLLIAYVVRILYTNGHSLARVIAISIIAALVSFSLWSGVSHATGEKVVWKMSPSVRDSIQFLQTQSIQGDRVAYDFLNWEALSIAVYLIDPSLKPPNQFMVEAGDPDIESLLPEKFKEQNIYLSKTPDKKISELHAFIHGKQPRFIVVANDQLYENLKKGEPYNAFRSNDYIRGYLSNKETQDSKNSIYVFRSPYILPEVDIPFAKIHENESFIILERLKNG